MAKGLDLTPMPKTLKDGDPVLAKKGGNAYLMFDGANVFVIAYAKNGGCSVDARRANLNNVRKVLLENYKVKLSSSEDEGMQATEMYSFTDDSLYKGGIASLTYEKDDINNGLISLGYMPQSIVPLKVSLETIGARLSKTNSHAEPDSLLGIFNGLCIINDGDVSKMKRTILHYGFLEIPGKAAKAFPITHNQDGRAYALINNKKIYFAGINNKGVCEVMVEHADPGKINRDVEEKFNAKFIKDVLNEGFVSKVFQIYNAKEKKSSLLVVRYFPGREQNELLVRYVPNVVGDQGSQLLSFFHKKASSQKTMIDNEAASIEDNQYLNREKHFAVILNGEWRKTVSLEPGSLLMLICSGSQCYPSKRKTSIEFGAHFVPSKSQASQEDFFSNADNSAFINAYMEYVRKAPLINNVKLIKNGVEMLGNYKTYEIVTKYNIDGDGPVKNYSYLSFKNGYFYYTVVVCSPEACDHDLPLAKKIISTFKYIE